MRRLITLFGFAVAFVGCNCQPANCQTLDAEFNGPPTIAATAEHHVIEAGDNFHRAVIQAAIAQVKRGEMKRGDLIRLRVAMLSPSFREAAEDLAVIQMAASGSDNVPTDDDGKVIRAQIDWDAIIAFIEKLIPLILQLIEIFGGMADIQFDLFMDGGLMHANVFVNGHYFGTVV